MCIEIPSIAATHLLIGLFVFVAGDGHHVRPIGWLHDDSGEEGTGDVEGRGAVVQRALDTRTEDLLGRLVAVDALLQSVSRKHET